MFERREALEQQQQLSVVAGELPAAVRDGFYRRVNATFEKIGFARQVWNNSKPSTGCCSGRCTRMDCCGGASWASIYCRASSLRKMLGDD